MPLWGTTSEVKPKWLTDEEKKDTYATASGWTVPAGGTANPNAAREILVAIGGLTTAMANASITAIEFVTTSASQNTGYTLDVLVRFNEAVDVTGNPTIEVTNDQTGGGADASPTLAYTAGTGTHEITFSVVMGVANNDIAANSSASDVLSIGGQEILLAGGTINDAGTALGADYTISAAQGTAAGTLTVVE
tara:strand:- start:17370 stop:17945 length:576 start_codon:yes stop_codon:yes gene_type:complete